jgi:acyl-CoA reductase-like NAD-dependent aldehyde dehydrogenase
MKVVQKQMAGLAVTVKPFETEEEAISVANESRYSLVSYIYTRDHRKGCT